MKTKETKEEKKDTQSKANIVGETYNDIMNADTKKNMDCEIEQQNELINPDPNSMDSRG